MLAVVDLLDDCRARSVGAPFGASPVVGSFLVDEFTRFESSPPV